MNEEQTYILIAAFLSGEANADQVNDLRVWLAESEQNKTEFEEIKDVWINTHFDQRAGKLDFLYEQAKNKIHSDSSEKVRSLDHHSFRIKYLNFTKWTAAAAVVVVFSIIAMLQWRSPETPHQTPVENIVKANPAGLKTIFALPDGTKVTLNSESKITYNSLYGQENRDIHLEGEAYFEVEKNPLLPFRVTSAGQMVEALGTEFNVRAFNDEGQFTVMLVEGRVNIRKESLRDQTRAGVTLNPGESFVADLTSGQIKVNKLEEDQLLWKEGVIQFKRATMDEVIKALERWYGVHFIVSGNINADWNYTGKFTDETLENVLHSISYSKQFEFEIENKDVIVKPKL